MKDGFPRAARAALADSQLRRNLGHATTTIRDKRARVVAEVPDWEALRDAGAEIKDRALRHLDVHLERLEEAVQRAGGTVHWARDGAEAAAVVADVARAHGSDEVIKVKSLATDEIDLNGRLEAVGVHAVETDLAELINQLSGDTSSHILVPAIHRNRAQIAALFRRELGVEVSDEPAELTAAARAHLRAKFLSVPVGVSGANFAVAETGHVVVLESEGNGRMCTTLPEVLVSVVGIEKILPRWRDLEVMLQLLPRSSTGERMNPYTSIWSGVADGDGPREFHLVLLDAGRTDVLADEVGRAALRCIRCSACLNVCPVYERTGGHAYESVYPGTDRRDPHAAAAGPRERADAAVGQLAVRRLLRGLPGQDRHPVDPRAPARARRARGRRAGARARGDGRDGARVRQPPRLRGRAARRQARARAAGRRGAAAVDALARAARGARADLQGLVALHAAAAPSDVLARACARALRDVPAGEALEPPQPTSRRRPPAATPSRASPSACRTTAPPCARPTTSPRPSGRCAPSTTRAGSGVPTGLLEGWRPGRHRARRGPRPERPRARRPRRRPHGLRAGHRGDRARSSSTAASARAGAR